jgi:peptidyl-prolyl cis-trans isomerase B (cyclophilin B)
MEYKAEFNKNKHYRGALSMARYQDQDSAGSQFFIVLKDSNLLDEQYRVFGRVMSGMMR